jgi:hypothetical protein
VVRPSVTGSVHAQGDNARAGRLENNSRLAHITRACKVSVALDHLWFYALIFVILPLIIFIYITRPFSKLTLNFQRSEFFQKGCSRKALLMILISLLIALPYAYLRWKTIQTTVPGLVRIDLQLIAMVRDASHRLKLLSFGDGNEFPRLVVPCGGALLPQSTIFSMTAFVMSATYRMISPGRPACSWNSGAESGAENGTSGLSRASSLSCWARPVPVKAP